MTFATLVVRSVRHHARTNLAVMAGAVVGTAVLGGALLVGDSVRGSLRAMTLGRLEGTDYALVVPRLLAEPGRATDGTAPAASSPNDGPVGILQLRGSVARAGDPLAVAKVSVLGVPAGFWRRTATAEPAFGEGGAAINDVLAADLALQGRPVAIGDALELRLERPDDVHRESLFGGRKFTDTVKSVPLTLRTVAGADTGAGRFSLAGGQQAGRTLLMPLEDLQRALGRRGQVNALLWSSTVPPEDVDGRRAGLVALQSAFDATVRTADLGLGFRAKVTGGRRDASLAPDPVVHPEGWVQVESPQMVLDPAAERAVVAAAESLGLRAVPILTHLANDIEAGGRRVRYSTVTAVDAAAAGLVLMDGTPAPALEPGEVYVGEWAAARADLDLLSAAAGTPVTLRYYVEGERGALLTRETVFRLRGIVKQDAVSADRRFAPDFPGITDKADMGSWEAPFEIDRAYLSRIPPRDDQYWRRYKTAPKAFVSPADGRRLFAGRFGQTTGVRLLEGKARPADVADKLPAALKREMPPASTGLVIRDVKAEGLAASAGATDFAGLFAGFSFFLIVSAAMLVGLMFRLGVDGRLRELGVLAATGWPTWRLRRLLLAEGALVAVPAGVLGAAGAVGYAWLMLAGLRTLWVDAVGTGRLELHVSPASLLIGAAAGPVVAGLALWLAVRGLRGVAPRALLGGAEAVYSPLTQAEAAGELARGGRSGPLSRAWAGLLLRLPGALPAGVVLTVVGVGTGVWSAWLEGEARAGATFGAGFALLGGLLCLTAVRLRGTGRAAAHRGLVQLAARNAGRRPARSLLAVGLTASAVFLIAAVAAQTRDPSADARRRDGGGGGFALVVETDIPVVVDLNTRKGREEVGFRPEDEASLAGVTFVPFRLRPGDEAGCRNLYRPQEPRVLGVPEELIRRGGFRFDALRPAPGAPEVAKDAPWTVLRSGPGRAADVAESGTKPVVPALGDSAAVTWILHKSLGDIVDVRTDAGGGAGLRLTGLLGGSLFQSELLVHEADFVRLFPARSGHRVFLIEIIDGGAAAAAGGTASERTTEIARLVARRMAEFGPDVETTAARLASYAAVENTYLDTFRRLGGLGLLLGTLGLGAVMMRSVLERRGELALLRAMGFTPGRLGRLILWEAAALTVTGLVIGLAAAAPAVVPKLGSGGADAFPLADFAPTPAAVLVAGLASAAWAARAALRTPLLPALRAE